MEMTYWYWWALAIILIILEMLIPGTFFMGAAVAAAGVGLLVFLFSTVSLDYQVLVFSTVSIIIVIISRFLLNKNLFPDESSLSNHRGAGYVGRTFILTDSIVNGIGRIHADDGFWRVAGPDCPAGSRVKVIGVEGIRLRVQPLSSEETHD